MDIPANYKSALLEALALARGMEGHLTEREMKFLFMAGACPTVSGASRDVLEIGSFKGRSTVLLARANRLAGKGKVVAVDPLTSPSATDPYLGGKESGWEDFKLNLKKGGVEGEVEFHRMFSREFAKSWAGKLRLLWIDGDHTYEGAKADYDLFAGSLSIGGIIAIHDVLTLGSFDGPLRVFMEDVLLSEKFGPAGLVGTIGWAQRLDDGARSADLGEKNLRLHKKLSRLLPYALPDGPLRGMRKFRYKLLRALVPHSGVAPGKWLDALRAGR